MKRIFVIVILFIAPVTLVSCAPDSGNAPPSNATAAPAPPDAVTADAAHYSVLFENDAARVIRIKYPAGAKSVMHTHPAGCGIFLVDQKFRFTEASGEAQIDETQAGQVMCGDAEAHLPENVGDKDAEVILLELKNRKAFDNVQTGKSISVSSAPNVPDAVAADPRHYSVQFENDDVRLLRIKYGAGEKSVMHAHPASCSVILTRSVFKMTLGDSKVSTSEDEPGTVGCVDAGVHLPENTGKTPAEVILIEFKNRQTFKS